MRVRQRGRPRATDENASLLNEAIFQSGLTTSIHQAKGYGPASFARTSAGWTLNDEGKLVNVPSGAARFHGARLVANRLPAAASSEDFTPSAWVKSNVTVSGKKTIVSTAGSAVQRIYPSSVVTIAYAETWCISARLTYINHPFVQVMLHTGYSDRINFDIQNGIFTPYGDVTGDMTQVSPGVWDIYVICNTPSINTTSSKPVFIFATSLGSSAAASFTGDGVLSFGLDRVMLENVSGQSNMTPSEYIPNTTFPIEKNILTYTNDFTQAAWSKTNITLTHGSIANPINGCVDGIKVEATATASATLAYVGTGLAKAEGINFVVYAKRGSGDTDGNKFLIRNNTTATNLLGATIDYSTGAITYTVGASGVTAENAGDGWWKITMIQASGFSDGDAVYVYPGYTGGSEVAGEYSYMYLPHVGIGITPPQSLTPVAVSWDPYGSGEQSTRWFANKRDGSGISNLLDAGGMVNENGARTNTVLFSRDLAGPKSDEYDSGSTVKAWIPTTTGSELVSNGTFNSDLTGWTTSGATNTWSSGKARVDTTSTAGGIYQNVSVTIGKTYLLTGSVTVISGSNCGARVYTDDTFTTRLKSQLLSSTHTLNIIFTATSSLHRIYLISSSTGSIVEFDNISVLEVTCSPQRTAVGLCGGINTATTLTATDANAVIYQPSTLASVARSLSAYVKRKTGSGSIHIGIWAGAGAQSWTEITSQINSTTWTRVHIDNITVLDPSIGFKIDSNGDEIEIDVVQLEAGVTSSAPIVTLGATVTRNADVLTYQRFGNYDTSVGGALCSWGFAGQGPTVAGSSSNVVGVGGANHNFMRCGNGSGTVRGNMRDGTTTLISYPGADRANYVPRRQASSWGATYGIQTNVEASGLVNSAGYDGSMAETDVLQFGGGVFVGTIKECRIWGRELTSAELLALGD